MTIKTAKNYTEEARVIITEAYDKLQALNVEFFTQFGEDVAHASLPAAIQQIQYNPIAPTITVSPIILTNQG